MKILEKELWKSSPESDIEWEDNIIRPKKQNIYDCILCGKPKLSVKSKDPCQNCTELYPDNRKCQSCGRVYPDQTCFLEEGSCCKYCIKRKTKTKQKIYNKKIEKPSKKTLKSVDLKLGEVLIGKFFIDKQNGGTDGQN